MKLSKHFALSEFTKSQTASRMGIYNCPSAHATGNMRILCELVLEPVRDRFGATIISSGYRSPALNVAVGSSGTSSHPRGEAADMECPGTSNPELARWIRDNLEFDQLILEYWDGSDPNSGWVHVSFREGRNRREVLTKNRGQPYVNGLPPQS